MDNETKCNFIRIEKVVKGFVMSMVFTLWTSDLNCIKILYDTCKEGIKR